MATVNGVPILQMDNNTRLAAFAFLMRIIPHDIVNTMLLTVIVLDESCSHVLSSMLHKFMTDEWKALTGFAYDCSRPGNCRRRANDYLQRMLNDAARCWYLFNITVLHPCFRWVLAACATALNITDQERLNAVDAIRATGEAMSDISYSETLFELLQRLPFDMASNVMKTWLWPLVQQVPQTVAMNCPEKRFKELGAVAYVLQAYCIASCNIARTVKASNIQLFRAIQNYIIRCIAAAAATTNYNADVRMPIGVKLVDSPLFSDAHNLMGTVHALVSHGNDWWLPYIKAKCRELLTTPAQLQPDHPFEIVPDEEAEAEAEDEIDGEVATTIADLEFSDAPSGAVQTTLHSDEVVEDDESNAAEEAVFTHEHNGRMVHVPWGTVDLCYRYTVLS